MQGEVFTKFAVLHRNVQGDGRRVVQRVLSNVRQMFVDRGYHNVSVVDEVEDASLPAVTSDEQDAFLHWEDKVGVKHARHILDVCEAKGKRGLILSIEGPTPFTRKEVENSNLEFFLAKELFVNVTKHHLVPRHTVVEDTKDAIPPYPSSDPIVRYYGWKPGTVVRIDRMFCGSEPIPYFRRVVA